MTTAEAPTAQELSTLLGKSLPAPNADVDRYLDLGVWDQAIIESLVVFVEVGKPLPSDVRDIVIGFLDSPDVSPKLRRHARHYFDEIPS
jgi:hypothetical protein